jgi:hypothetical protein
LPGDGARNITFSEGRCSLMDKDTSRNYMVYECMVYGV